MTVQLVSALLALTAGTAASQLLRLRGLLEHLLATLTVALCDVVLTMTITGVALTSLRPATILCVQFLIAALLAVPAARRYRSLHSRVGRATARDPVAEPSAVHVSTGITKEHLLWSVAMALVAAGHFIYLTYLVLFVPPYAWDALFYHLPMSVGWIQHGYISQLPFSVFSNSYPGNAELLFAWLMIFRHDDMLVGFGQVLFAVGGIVAVGAIARSVGVSRAGAAAAGALYFLTPIVLVQANTGYNDLAVASSFLMAIAFALRAAELTPVSAIAGKPYDQLRRASAQNGSSADRLLTGRRTSYVILAGLAAGLGAGTKTTGLIQAAAVGAVVAGILALEVIKRRGRIGHAVATLGIFTLAVGTMGGYWYIRNIAEFSNPVYPVRIGGASAPIFNGLGSAQQMAAGQLPSQLRGKSAFIQTISSWSHEPFLSRSACECYQYDQRLGGYGPQWILLELPALIAFIAYTAYRRRTLLLALVLPFVAVFVLQPAFWWPRFTIAVAALGVIALVFWFERVRPRVARSILLLASAILVTLAASWTLDRPLVANKTLKLSHALELRHAPIRQRSIGRVVAPFFTWIDEIPPGSRIGILRDEVFPGGNGAVAPEAFVYGFFGHQFRNRLNAYSGPQSDLVAWLRRTRTDYFLTATGSPADRSLAERNIAVFRKTPYHTIYRTALK